MILLICVLCERLFLFLRFVLFPFHLPGDIIAKLVFDYMLRQVGGSDNLYFAPVALAQTGGKLLYSVKTKQRGMEYPLR